MIFSSEPIIKGRQERVNSHETPIKANPSNQESASTPQSEAKAFSFRDLDLSSPSRTPIRNTGKSPISSSIRSVTPRKANHQTKTEIVFIVIDEVSYLPSPFLEYFIIDELIFR